MSTDLAGFYRGRSVLVTGHTGFKGTWLVHWLHRMGARVTGFALAPDTSPSLFALAGAASRCRHVEGDLLDRALLSEVVREAEPSVVFHLAAQALVRRSYQTPVETFGVNVMGTAHVLEACRASSTVRAIVGVTTDKCYENVEQLWPYRETDKLGGRDPYSASKAAAELVISSYRDSFLRERGVGVASARAGNVIGGGDWAEDRLVPDLVRGASRDETVAIRNPAATRPWQHVLDPLHGYLLLAARLTEEPSRFGEAWNFGPSSLPVEVGAVSTRFMELLGRGAVSLTDRPKGEHPHEAHLLAVDSTKAILRLGWRPRFDLERAVELTATWYREHLAACGTETSLMDAQIDAYGA